MLENGSMKAAKTKDQVNKTVAWQWRRTFLAKTVRTAEFSENQASEKDSSYLGRQQGGSMCEA